MFIYELYYFLFFPNQRYRPPIKGVSQVLCLERLWSQTYFLRFETKFSQFFFYCSQNCIFLSNYITDSWRSCEGAVLCHHFLYVTFCVTYDPFSTQRPLVKILQRRVIGKTYSACSLSDIIGERCVPLQKKMWLKYRSSDFKLSVQESTIFWVLQCPYPKFLVESV